MSSFATTSGSGPFKAVIRMGENVYETAHVYEIEDKALTVAEKIFKKICLEQAHILNKYGFVSVDK